MPRTIRRALLITAAIAVFALPVIVNAAGGFDDVDDTNVFKADIQWLADNGITKGCNPPDNTLFCPENEVTRQQMAAFMHRLATQKVVDANTALTATKADTVGGKTATEVSGVAASATFESVIFTPVVENPFIVVSLTGFDVPASGGVLTATVDGAGVRDSGQVEAGLWIEIDGTGICDPTTSPPGFSFYETVSSNLTSLNASNAAEVAAGAHRIDVCTATFHPDSTRLSGRLNVVWSETSSSAGVASSTSGQSWQELLAHNDGALDN